MPNELEKFVQRNREAFDDEVPSEKVWKNIDREFVKEPAKKTPVYKNIAVRIMAAAAVVFAACLATWYFTVNSIHQGTAGTVANKKPVDTAQQQVAIQPSKPDSANLAVVTPPEKDNSNEQATGNNYTQEIYYYTKLSEIKFNELKKLEKDEPLLYKSFAGEIQKLDSTYRNLQAMLASNADKEAVLQAMLTNLKMQTEILNKQLDIIHTIKQSKNNKDENKFQSI